MHQAATAGVAREFLAQLADINVWSANGVRAPHKPLLLLRTLGRVQRGGPRTESFSELEAHLRDLLEEFGPPRRGHNPHQPFWRLRSDGSIWEVEPLESVRQTASGDAFISDLREQGVAAGLTVEIDAACRRDPDLIEQAARLLLARHFPPTIFEDVLAATGVDVDLTAPFAVTAWSDVLSTRPVRDARFRPQVMAAYEGRCALCGFDGRFERRPVALDAAHIRWHALGGSDEPGNGVVLCSIHHVLFDRGLFCIEDDLTVSVSTHFEGGVGAESVLSDRHGQAIAPPVDRAWLPSAANLAWHRDQVYRAA